MQFNVELSELAENQYDNILSYISNVLKNPQALENVMNDFDDTIYLFAYRIIDSKVIVEGMYHELQDYENSIN